VNPAAAHRDRRWFDERTLLTAETGRPVDLSANWHLIHAPALGRFE